MTVQAVPLILLVVIASIAHATGEDIAKRIKDRYNNAADKCFDARGNEKPAYECSGIMIRGVNNKDRNLESGWGMKDLNKQKDAFSLGYLRRDQVFSAFPRDYESGFIIYPHLSTPSKKNSYKVFCSFPMDAHTDAREGHGCGKSSSDRTGESTHCGLQNIKTFNSWTTHFIKIINSRDNNFVIRQCGFDMTIKSAAKDFGLSLEANRYIQSHSTKYAFRNNELRMHAWSEKKAQNLPIEAFFYLIGSAQGKSLAEKYQDEFYDRSGGEIVPIVGIALPTAHRQFEVNSYDRTPPKSLPNDYYDISMDISPNFDYGNRRHDFGNSPVYDYINSDMNNKNSHDYNSPNDYINLPKSTHDYGNPPNYYENSPNDYGNSPDYDFSY